jgi:arylsulfatase A-like enzyme
MAQNLDILPTVLDYLGVEAAGLGLEGRSLRRVIESDEPVNEAAFSVQGHLRAVRRGDLKLIVDRFGQTRRLYDLARDPGEQQPVGDSARAQAMRALEQELEAWEQRTRDVEEPDVRAERDADTDARLRALGYLE